MSYIKAKAHLEKFGFLKRIKVFDVSSATVTLASKALGTAEGSIAKSLTFDVRGEVVMVLFAGDKKVDNHKFKEQFGVKPSMLAPALVEEKVGHSVGGVCPFGVNEGVKVFLDKSISLHEKIYPACGTDNSAVELSPTELEKCSKSLGWIDVSKE